MRLAATRHLGYLAAMRFCSLCALFTLLTLAPAGAGQLTAAVASNFAVAAEAIADRFTAETGHDVRVSTASTGVLYAQIVNGAPFDVLLAADSERPRLLEEAGEGVAGTRFTYAIGRLVLWSRDKKLAGMDCRARLEDLGRDRLAIANPRTAPYGNAAREFLQAAGLWDRVSPRLVFGENIAQTLQFVATGNATLGLIAEAQAVDPRLPPATCSWPVPAEMHAPIAQQGILLKRAIDNPAATAFVEFLRSRTAQQIILRHGYSVSR
jgi:molybdate transport system substrate-binding protein